MTDDRQLTLQAGLICYITLRTLLPPHTEMINLDNSKPVIISFLFSTIVPMALGLFLSATFPEWRWSHYPFHSMVESIGAFCAFTVATLMIIMVHYDHLDARFVIAALALIGMGILDGFHAVLHAGASFVWLHSIATLVGGVIFALIWLPRKNHSKQVMLPLTVLVIGCLALGLVSMLYPEILPAMIEDGEFTVVARFTNIVGGIGFLVGSGYFVYQYFRSRHRLDHSDYTRYIIFSNHCLLFGIAGLLFEYSVLWDAGWWWWHILRLLAYIVALVYLFSQFSQAQKQLTAYTTRLEHLNASKSLFLANMSHELRTPMHAIFSFSEMGVKRFDNAPQEKLFSYFSRINESAVRLTLLLNDLLDLSKLESGKSVYDFKDNSLNKAVDSVVNELATLAKDKQLQISVRSSRDNITGVFDWEKILQVIRNLLANAIKFTPEHKKILLSLSTTSDAFLKFTIADQGIGLPKGELESVFDAFIQSSKTRSKAGGTGLGLAISKEIIEGHGGQIMAANNRDHGASFTFLIPRYQETLAQVT